MKTTIVNALTIIGQPARKRAVGLLGVALLLAAAGAFFAAGAGRGSTSAKSARAKQRYSVVRLAHGPVTAAHTRYVDTPPAGPSAGDVRTYYLPLTRPGSRRTIGYLTGTLTTTAIDRPSAGKELRAANLIFVTGASANQIVVGGVAAYAQKASTLSQKSVTVRPVIGGSGKYAGARGWCVSTHYANDTWTHVFHLRF